MDKCKRQSGFSLTEVLLAVGVLAVGMMVVAGVYPTALYFATLSTEKTIASAAADEAFAKIRLYDVNGFGSPPWEVTGYPHDESIPYRVVGTGLMYGSAQSSNGFNYRIYLRSSPTGNKQHSEYVYPTDTAPITGKDYSWSAVCRRIDNSAVQVTVFVSRLIGAGDKYYWWDDDNGLVETGAPLPEAVKVQIDAGYGELNEIQIIDNGYNERQFFSRGSKIVDDETGIIYEVQERYTAEPDVIRLDKNWYPGNVTGNEYVWVVPPPVNGGRKPCVGVYQKIVRF